MATVQGSIQIVRPRETVWPHVAEPARLAAWFIPVVTAMSDGDGAIAPGDRWEYEQKVLGVRLRQASRVEEVVTPERVVQRSEAGPFGWTSWALLEPFDGGTALTLRFEAEAGLGGVFGRLADRVVEQRYGALVDASLDALKARLERPRTREGVPH